RINQVAAWVSKQPGPQVEVAQRPPLTVARTARGELRGEPRAPLDRAVERSLTGEEQSGDKLLGVRGDPTPAALREESLGPAQGLVDARVVIAGHLALIAGQGEQVLGLRLVLQHHE